MATAQVSSLQAQLAQYASQIQAAQQTLASLENQAGQLQSTINEQIAQIGQLQSELAIKQQQPRQVPITTSPTSAYPYAFLVADREDYSLVANAGVPRAAIYYVGTDPLASQAGHGAGYSPASFLTTYTGGSGQPSQTVVVGLAGRVRSGSVATLIGATRVQTQQLLSQFLSSHPQALQ